MAGEAERVGDWHGYTRYDFVVDGRAALLVCPHAPAAGRPWIWRTEFFGHAPQADLELLRHGLHLAYIDLQDMYGGPAALEHMDAFHHHLQTAWGLSPRPALEGFSRGGLHAHLWAARRPDRVACIYADAPVCDIRSWPGGRGRGPGSPADWRRCLAAHGLTEAEADAFAGNPVDLLVPLAEWGVPLLHVCGGADTAVPLEENTAVLAPRYRALGGPIEVIVKPFCGHHPHSLRNPAPIVDFVRRHTGAELTSRRPDAVPCGYDYHVPRDGLDNCRRRFLEGEGRVAFLGGSITAGGGWRELVADQLRQRFPAARLEFLNAGIPSLDSTAGAFRLQRDVLSRGRLDLLFCEAAVNDQTNGRTPQEQVRGMEGIVRQVRRADPGTDIVLLHFADPEKLADIRAGAVPAVIAAHESVAEHYGLPSLDLAQEVAERIHAGEFSWERDFRDLHPSPFGHSLYARAVSRLFDALWAEAAGTGRPHALPAPLDPAAYDRARLEDVSAAQAGAGWRLVPAWRPEDGAATRAGFVGTTTLVAEEPGATLTLPFRGTAAGIFVVAGPDAGAVAHRVDGGDEATLDLYTRWSGALHLPWAQVPVAGLPPGEHTLQLRVLQEAHPASRGHAVRIVHFLVAEGT